MQTVKITADSTGVVADLLELSKLADSAELSPKVVNRLIGLLNVGLEVSGVEILSASGADELRVGFKLSDGLREFAAALRAGNIDSEVIQVVGHAGESITKQG